MAEAWHARSRPGRVAQAVSRLAPAYALDPDGIAEVTRDAVARARVSVGLSAEARRRELFTRVIDGLDERFPRRIDRDPEWLLTRCGGAEMTLGILYGAPNEYLAFCGTNLGISGADSGSYPADVWDFILEGDNYNAGASPFDPVEVTRAGEVTFLGSGDRKKWSLTGPGWMLDYARGVVPAMFWHGNVEALLLTTNVKGFVGLVRAFAKSTVRQLTRTP
jgi:C-8 sterol isomerase